MTPSADSNRLEESPPPYVSEKALEQARRLVKEFPECFWFRHPEATTDNRDDILLVIRHLREYGGHRAWYAAQDLWKCL